MNEPKTHSFTLSAGSTSVFILDLDDEAQALDMGRRWNGAALC